MDVSGIKCPDADVYLCVLLFLSQDGQTGAQLCPCPHTGAIAACWGVTPACTESSAPCATVQDCTQLQFVHLSVVYLSPGSSLQSPAKADTRCPWSNWVKKTRETGCAKEKPECSLHLTSSLVDYLDIRLWASVYWRELL